MPSVCGLYFFTACGGNFCGKLPACPGSGAGDHGAVGDHDRGFHRADHLRKECR